MSLNQTLPPDFLVNGRTAVEVRRLNQNVITESGERQALEETWIPFNMRFRNLLASFGPPRAWYGWHAFRRGLATDLSQTEKNVKVAQGALRHSDAAITLRHYAKTVDDDVRRAVEERSARLAISLTDSYRTAVEQQASEPQSVN